MKSGSFETVNILTTELSIEDSFCPAAKAGNEMHNIENKLKNNIFLIKPPEASPAPLFHPF
jgi:hypothetical protein